MTLTELECFNYLIETCGYDLCYSIGSTRLTPREFECRIFPRRQDEREPVVIQNGKTFLEAMSLALERLGN